MKASGWFLLVSALFIACLLSANITAVKLVTFGGVVLPAAILIFPLSYIVGDVLTEVYGYAAARRVIWLGFLANLVLVLFILVAGALPGAPGLWTEADQQAYERVLGFTPRILTASFLAYLVGEFANAYVLARMKVWTRGRWLFSRTLGSTVVGQLLDSLVFITLAFLGRVPGSVLLGMVVTQWLAKVAYEALATPLTYAVVTFLKRVEGVDAYDIHTRFNPLALRE